MIKGDYVKLGNSLIRFLEVVGQNLRPILKKNSNVLEKQTVER